MSVENGVGELYIYGPIGSSFWADGHTPKSVQDALERMKAEGAKELRVYVHSLGGSAVDGFGIYSVLRRFPGKKTMVVEGVAASAASVILMAGDVIQASKVGMIMIHEASNLCAGTAKDMRQNADGLDAITDAAVAAYVSRTGMDEKAVRKLLAEETWMSAERAKELKFIDAILESDDEGGDDDESEMRLDPATAAIFATYRNAPAALEKLLKSTQPPSVAQVAATATKQEREMNEAELKAMQDKIAASEKTVADATARADAGEKFQSEFMAAFGKTSVSDAMAALAGLKEVAAKVPELQAEIAKRDTALAAHVEEKRACEITAMLDAASKDGRLSPANREKLAAADAPVFAKDPANLKSYLDMLPKAVVTVDAPRLAPKPDEEIMAALSEDEKRFAEQLKLDPKKVAETKKAMS